MFAFDYLDADGNVLGSPAQAGSVEVLEAPLTPGAKGKVRLSAKGKDSELSGTIELLVCP